MKDESKLAYWPNIDAELHKSRNVIECLQIGKNLKSSKCKTDPEKMRPLYRTNQEIQIDHYGRVTEKGTSRYIIVATNRY